MSGGAVRGVLFDKDGTLFDFHATWAPWCLRLLDDLAAGDPALRQRLGDAVGFDSAAVRFRPGSPVLADTPDIIAGHLLPHLTGWEPDALLAHLNALAADVPQVETLPLAAFFDGLKARGLALGVATNDAEAPARAHLAVAGVLHRLDFVSGCDSGHGAKPAPGPLLAFARATGLEPGQVAMVGDSAHDLHAARAAGMIAVAVTRGASDPAGLSALADVVLEDIGALPGWIGS